MALFSQMGGMMGNNGSTAGASPSSYDFSLGQTAGGNFGANADYSATGGEF